MSTSTNADRRSYSITHIEGTRVTCTFLLGSKLGAVLAEMQDLVRDKGLTAVTTINGTLIEVSPLRKRKKVMKCHE